MIYNRRLHPAAIPLTGLRTLREGALPLVVIGGISVARGGFEAGDALTALPFVVLGAVLAAVSGSLTWATTRFSVDERAIELRSGLLARKQTTVPLERVQGLDELAGPLHRLFGVTRVDVQTAGGKAGGEISLIAVGPETVVALRQVVGREAPALVAAPAGPVRRLSRGALVVAALTAGRLGVLLPVVAFVPQVLSEAFPDDPGDADPSALLGLAPESARDWLVLGLVALAIAWLLSALGVLVAFAGFEIRREKDRLVIRRGFLQRRSATVPIARVQAVRVVEGVLRQPFGLASLRVEVAGYASEEAAAQTIFPLLRVRDVDAFVAEVLPEMPHRLGPLQPLPRRALRRYLLLPALLGLPLGFLMTLAVDTPVPLAFLAGRARRRPARPRPLPRRRLARAGRRRRAALPPPGPHHADRPAAALPGPRGQPERPAAPRGSRRLRDLARRGRRRPRPPPRGGGCVGDLAGRDHFTLTSSTRKLDASDPSFATANSIRTVWPG